MDIEKIDELRDITMGAGNEIRVLNRNFSLAEYDESWKKIERFLFIEVYNIIKEFYTDKSDTNIVSFSSESIMIKLPINMLDKKLFNPKNRSAQLAVASEELMNKKIKKISFEANGQMGFDFITIFPKISYDPSRDKDNILVRIPSEVYEEMVPIKSYCQLDLKLISDFNSGNTIRLYEIFKSYAFKGKVDISFTELRKKLGFFKAGKYPQWKYFNAKVLKPAVEEINLRKEEDIEVQYKKERSSETISFTIITHKQAQAGDINVLSEDEIINRDSRELNKLQANYIATVLRHCNKVTPISNKQELTQWIISDLINQQQKQKNDFAFKYSMNAISKQIREGKYKEPFAHKHLIKQTVFDEEIHNAIKMLEIDGQIEKILEDYTPEQIKANRFGYLLED